MGSRTPRRLVLRAAAKVNLALEILGRRDDGYHELATVMQAVDLSDRLTLEEADTVELTTDCPDVPSDGGNLAWQAAAALREATGVARGVRITLEKRIPVAAGLGGGSSDAAATLLGLNRLWKLHWGLEPLRELGATLGMDVPFFLGGGAALATGRGDRVVALESRALALVLVHPCRGISTAQAYAAVKPGMYSDGTRTRALARALATRAPARLAPDLYNALEAAVLPAHPEVARMRAALSAAGALGTAMSGSGPTVFGLARSFEHARQIRARVVRGSWACWAVRALRGPAVRLGAGTGRGRRRTGTPR